MAKLTCRKKDCQSTYFEKIKVNEFHDYSGSLYNALPEVEIDNDIRGYKCIACGTINFPTLDYTNTEVDRQLAKDLIKLVDSGQVEEEVKYPKRNRIMPGSAQVVEKETYDPSQDGKFVRS
jgi:hypothetical protein